MIEIEKGLLVVLAFVSFLAGVLVALSIFLSIMLERISKRMQSLADKMKGISS